MAPGDPSVAGIAAHVPGGDHDRPAPADLGDEVARAMAFLRASTGRAPASSGRLRRKLAEREVPAPAIRVALDRAGDLGMVDDPAMAAAIADEARAKGHAPRRIRADLRSREFDADVIDAAVARFNDRDPEALAFDVAQRRARSLRGLDSETAFRRLVGYLARRGHSEPLARKVARQVVFDDREQDRITGH